MDSVTPGGLGSTYGGSPTDLWSAGQCDTFSTTDDNRA